MKILKVLLEKTTHIFFHLDSILGVMGILLILMGVAVAPVHISVKLIVVGIIFIVLYIISE